MPGVELRDPLHIVASNGNYEIVEYLLDNGARVDDLDYGETTPLTLAVIKGLMANKIDSERYLKTISLLERGALVNDIWLPGYDEDPYKPEEFSADVFPRTNLAADAAVNIARMAEDLPGENHRRDIYYLLNNAHAEELLIVLPIPESPLAAAPAPPASASAYMPSVGVPVLSPSSKKEKSKNKSRKSSSSSSSSSDGGGKRKQTKRKR